MLIPNSKHWRMLYVSAKKCCGVFSFIYGGQDFWTGPSCIVSPCLFLELKVGSFIGITHVPPLKVAWTWISQIFSCNREGLITTNVHLPAPIFEISISTILGAFFGNFFSSKFGVASLNLLCREFETIGRGGLVLKLDPHPVQNRGQLLCSGVNVGI